MSERDASNSSEVALVTADEIFGRQLAPAPWPSSRPVLALVVEVLPTIEDDLTADLLEHLALALADRETELRAVRHILSGALTEAHASQQEARRIRDRYHALIEARRAERRAA